MSSGFEILTVSQLNYYVRSQLDSDPMLRNVFVRGEISNFTNHFRSGHFYMSLKDENAVIKAVMFKNSAQRMTFLPENGMKVIAMGRASVYDRDGQYQFYIDDMQPDGVGALHIAFEQLKAKLSSQGLFDESRKRSLPPYPERIGIVTSPTGAAIQDILNILKRRWPIAKIILLPVLVQGAEAASQICRAVDYFSDTKTVDVVIVGRGGGSIEDLWAFNDENVARSIAACEVPIVSAVGHETDFTIADFSADMRAPTPSAAAEIVSPNTEDVFLQIEALSRNMSRAVCRKLDYCTQRLDTAVLSSAMKKPISAIEVHRARFESLKTALTDKTLNRILHQKSLFAAIASKLDALSPLKVILRGYSIASDNNEIISTVGRLRKTDNFTLRLSDGEAKCKVLETAVGHFDGDGFDEGEKNEKCEKRTNI